MPLALLGCGAFNPSPPVPAGSVFGSPDARELRRLCRAERIFVGTILRAEPFEERGMLHSWVSFQVERDILDAGQPVDEARAASMFTWTLPGGTLGPYTVERSHAPSPVVGARWLSDRVRTVEDLFSTTKTQRGLGRGWCLRLTR